jgi:hypothetical protein
MARKRNEIAMEWLKSKDKERINRVNVKHIIKEHQNTLKGAEVIVKLNS